MTDKIIFFNTAWMHFYNGVSNDSITGGGKQVERQGWGGEILNFKVFRGHVYGYVQPKIDKKHNNECTVKIERLGGSLEDEKIDGVTVVWTATDPENGGTYIVGWYRNATVYRYSQKAPTHSNRRYKKISLDFYATAKSKDSKLLSIDERNLLVRRAQRNWMGQSNVWYAENNSEFVEIVKKYILTGGTPNKIRKEIKPSYKPRQRDLLKKIKVETKAIELVTDHYTTLGYKVGSVERDNIGWDLEAVNEKKELKLEVKGLSGRTIVIELTPNEYNNLKLHKKNYRLCIVSDALSERPKLMIFAYCNEIRGWADEDGIVIKFEEIVSARVCV